MTLHLHHPGRDPEKDGLLPYALRYPRCVGATGISVANCPRCGATARDSCWDEEAYAVQTEERRQWAKARGEGAAR